MSESFESKRASLARRPAAALLAACAIAVVASVLVLSRLSALGELERMLRDAKQPQAIIDAALAAMREEERAGRLDWRPFQFEAQRQRAVERLVGAELDEVVYRLALGSRAPSGSDQADALRHAWYEARLLLRGGSAEKAWDALAKGARAITKPKRPAPLAGRRAIVEAIAADPLLEPIRALDPDRFAFLIETLSVDLDGSLSLAYWTCVELAKRRDPRIPYWYHGPARLDGELEQAAVAFDHPARAKLRLAMMAAARAEESYATRPGGMGSGRRQVLDSAFPILSRDPAARDFLLWAFAAHAVTMEAEVEEEIFNVHRHLRHLRNFGGDAGYRWYFLYPKFAALGEVEIAQACLRRAKASFQTCADASSSMPPGFLKLATEEVERPARNLDVAANRGVPPADLFREVRAYVDRVAPIPPQLAAWEAEFADEFPVPLEGDNLATDAIHDALREVLRWRAKPTGVEYANRLAAADSASAAAE